MDKEIVRKGNVSEQSVNLPDSTSKNVLLERKRREKMNRLLYNLRMVVPKISKMDKASTLADAIDHVQELRKKVDRVQNEIQSSLQSRNLSDLPLVEGRNDLIGKFTLGPHQHLLEVDVRIVETATVIDLRIRCKKGARILFLLSQAAGSLPLSLKNANFNSFGEDMLVNFVLQAESSFTNQKDVRQMIAEAFSRQGFYFVPAGDQLPSHSHEFE